MPLKIYTDTEIAPTMSTNRRYIVLAPSSHRQLLSVRAERLNPIQAYEDSRLVSVEEIW
jgi:hypothetical protein